jgi:hypothetical protein
MRARNKTIFRLLFFWIKSQCKKTFVATEAGTKAMADGWMFRFDENSWCSEVRVRCSNVNAICGAGRRRPNRRNGERAGRGDRAPWKADRLEPVTGQRNAKLDS